MAVRNSMVNLIARVRTLINDPPGSSQQFSDQIIQEVLDAGRIDTNYLRLDPQPTYTGSTIKFLDYYAPLGDWEDNITLWQYRIIPVTPSMSEPIVGHWAFTTTILPPVFLIGSLHDVYRAAADLLERWAASWVLRYNVTVDGQNLQRSQAATMLQQLAKTYRMQQRSLSVPFKRDDFNSKGAQPSLGPTEIDYMGSGDGR